MGIYLNSFIAQDVKEAHEYALSVKESMNIIVPSIFDYDEILNYVFYYDDYLNRVIIFTLRLDQPLFPNPDPSCVSKLVNIRGLKEKMKPNNDYYKLISM